MFQSRAIVIQLLRFHLSTKQQLDIITTEKKKKKLKTIYLDKPSNRDYHARCNFKSI